MAEVLPKDVLVRCGGRTLHVTSYLAAMGAGGGYQEVKETFARADGGTPIATLIDRNVGNGQILYTAAADKVRIEYPPALSGLVDQFGYPYCGPLLESARTNAWTKSQKLDDAVWTKDAASVTPNVGAGADSSSTADLIVEDGTNNLHGFERTTPALTDNTQQSVSVFASYFGTRLWFRIRTTDKSGALNSTFFNIGAGTIGTIGAGHTDVKIEGPIGRLGAQGYRCSLSFNSAAGATPPLVQFFLATADNSGAYLGDGVSGMVFWGLQFEVDKPFRSSYLATDAATISRAADSLRLPYLFGTNADITTLVRLARPVFVDTVGSLPNGPVMFRFGSANPCLYSNFAIATRSFVSRIFDPADHNVITAVPAGAEIRQVSQWKNLRTAGQTAQDVGSGYGAFTSAAVALAALFDQTLILGGDGAAGNEINGVLLDFIAARGLRTTAEMLAIP